MSFCSMIMQNVHTVIHMAANMGGMGAIHQKNDFIIHRENHAMTVNVLETALKSGVQCFLYASSACVYPESLQSDADNVVRLGEEDVWKNPPPAPQGLYGLEKLQGEMLLHQFQDKLDIRIARFHNVYGVGGTWHGGREKAPAAMARKAVAIKLTPDQKPIFELWGDGTQKRSFLYIDDAVDAVIRFLEVSSVSTVNIGSEDEVTLDELGHIAVASAGIDPNNVETDYDLSKPLGVMARTSNNDLVTEALNGWKPLIPLDYGMKLMTAWIEGQIRDNISKLPETDLPKYLSGLKKSVVVDLEHEAVTFGILLPITSRGTTLQTDCLENLKTFAESLERTTWRDTHALGGTLFHLKVYLALDHDDDILLKGSPAESILQAAGIVDITRIVCAYPKGHVCSLWRECAKRAWNDGCDYMMLLGDDTEFLDEGWMRDVIQEFSQLSDKNTAPLGFGCVAFTDETFLGMPTFPVLHRTHMDLFGDVVPHCFVNQDGDPYLFQLYRRFGCSQMIPSRIRNRIGGGSHARYRKEHAVDWTYEPLDDGTKTIVEWLKTHNHQVERKPTLDVVIPSYRVQMRFLKPILELKTTSTCSVMWIIVVDDPQLSTISELQHEYGARTDVRIRIHNSNLGASASRNRGMAESAGEWVHFLDDDVTPHPDLLIEAEAVIRAHPNAAGFVGNTQFPPADSIFKTAVHLAQVTYFWDIATKLHEDLPWGVTANLLVRRDVKDDVRFDHRFPKTGGGEDIDLCIRKRDWFVARHKEGFRAAPKVIVTHPWWNDGSRSYRQFYMWAKGDGALVSMFPQHCFLDSFPNSAELILYCLAFGSVGLVLPFRWLAASGYLGVAAVLLANTLHDLYHQITGHTPKDPRTILFGLSWTLAIIEGSFIRVISEGGRLVGQIERGEFKFLPVKPRKRFDWFVGRAGTGPIENERSRSRQKFVIWLSILIITRACFWRKCHCCIGGKRS
jgi:nucleoside-diphosphate-sugar epimerase/glycosyltransferase involved in cell wall biosynthesis